VSAPSPNLFQPIQTGTGAAKSSFITRIATPFSCLSTSWADRSLPACLVPAVRSPTSTPLSCRQGSMQGSWCAWTCPCPLRFRGALSFTTGLLYQMLHPSFDGCPPRFPYAGCKTGVQVCRSLEPHTSGAKCSLRMSAVMRACMLRFSSKDSQPAARRG
jgi:hypothetical protein